MLPIYQNETDKQKEFAYYEKVETFADLLKIKDQLEQRNFIYRGLNDGRFKNFNSAQRHWLTMDEYYQNIGGNTYKEFVANAIWRFRNDPYLTNFFKDRSILLNDFYILSVLQHYINISPLQDFTTNFLIGLFFAVDNYTESTGNGLQDYVSLYFIDPEIDWFRASIQSVTASGFEKVPDMIKEQRAATGLDINYSDYLKEVSNLAYYKYSEFPFLTIDGPLMGITKLSSKYLGFECEYNFNNPRIKQQEGLFIFNNSPEIPLVEQLNSATKTMYVSCIEINKRIIPEIKKKLFAPNFIEKDQIYPHTPDSDLLESLISKNFTPDSLKTKDFSIVIPHKNIPQLLQRCLDSIPEREDLEIIIVDDNSDPQKVDFKKFPGYNRKNVNLIFDKQGKGAGAARNIGMQAAKGKWVLFADADDSYTEIFNSFLDTYKNSPADIILFKVNVISENHCKKVTPNLNYFIDAYLKNKATEMDLKYGAWEPWNRMIKASIIRKNNIHFDEISSSNDKNFSLRLAKYLNRFEICSEKIYNYIQRPFSIMHSGKEKRFLNSFNTILEQNSIYHEVGYNRKYFIPYFFLSFREYMTKEIWKSYLKYLRKYRANPFEGFFSFFLFHIFKSK